MKTANRIIPAIKKTHTHNSECVPFAKWERKYYNFHEKNQDMNVTILIKIV